MLGPRLAGEGRSKATTSWPGGWMGWAANKVEGHTIKTMVSRERRVEGPRAQVIEGELGLGDQVGPAVRVKCDVGGRKDGDDVVFGGTN